MLIRFYLMQHFYSNLKLIDSNYLTLIYWSAIFYDKDKRLTLKWKKDIVKRNQVDLDKIIEREELIIKDNAEIIQAQSDQWK